MIAGPRHLALTIGALAAVLGTGCSSPRHDVERPVSHALKQPAETFLGRTQAAQLAATPGQSGFHLLVSGQEAFLARAAMAEAAERTLDLQYYIVGEDATATLLLQRALRAAQRGVRVRLLIDDMYAVGRDFDLATLAAQRNVEVRVFNPFLRRGPLGLLWLLEYLGDSTRLNRRMHNKLWIADNALAVIGGRNLGDAYFDVREESKFADLDLLAGGPVVAGISRSFDAYWNGEWAVPIEAFLGEPPASAQLRQLLSRMVARAEEFRATDYAETLRATDLGRLLRAGGLPLAPAIASALYDDPAKPQEGTDGTRGRILSVLRAAIEAAQREVILISPYYIPSERGAGRAARRAVRRGRGARSGVPRGTRRTAQRALAAPLDRRGEWQARALRERAAGRLVAAIRFGAAGRARAGGNAVTPAHRRSMPVPAPVPALPEQGLSAAAGVLSVARFEIVKPAAPWSPRLRGQGTRGGMTLRMIPARFV